jgi:hypothetical protein
MLEGWEERPRLRSRVKDIEIKMDFNRIVIGAKARKNEG